MTLKKIIFLCIPKWVNNNKRRLTLVQLLMMTTILEEETTGNDADSVSSISDGETMRRRRSMPRREESADSHDANEHPPEPTTPPSTNPQSSLFPIRREDLVPTIPPHELHESWTPQIFLKRSSTNSTLSPWGSGSMNKPPLRFRVLPTLPHGGWDKTFSRRSQEFCFRPNVLGCGPMVKHLCW